MTWETRHFIGLPLQDERWKTFHVQCFQVKYLEKSVTNVFSVVVLGIATGKSHKKCIYQLFGSKRPQALSDGQWGQLWRSWGSTLGALIEVHSVSTCVPRNGELLHLLYHFFKQFYWGIIYTAWNLPAVIIQLRDFFGTFTQLCHHDHSLVLEYFHLPQRISLCLFVFISCFLSSLKLPLICFLSLDVCFF